MPGQTLSFGKHSGLLVRSGAGTETAVGRFRTPRGMQPRGALSYFASALPATALSSGFAFASLDSLFFATSSSTLTSDVRPDGGDSARVFGHFGTEWAGMHAHSSPGSRTRTGIERFRGSCGFNSRAANRRHGRRGLGRDSRRTRGVSHRLTLRPGRRVRGSSNWRRFCA